MQQQKIYLFVLWFLEPEGSGQELTGGMERYCRDLARLIRRGGRQVHIFQKSHVPFELEYEPGIVVTGVPSALNVRGHIDFYRAVVRLVARDSPVIYVSQDLCLGGHFSRAIAINHGVWWHGDFSSWKKLLIRWHQRRMLAWLRGIICVDTNYINWLHAEFSGRNAWRGKLSYVCNYADTDVFNDRNRPQRSIRKLSIVFPRRMMGDTLADEPRGGLLLLEAIKLFRQKNPNVDFVVKMVGRGTLANALSRWCLDNDLQNHVEFFEAGFDQMPEIYRHADVVVIPSTATEGTSLSAIEGVCSGATTIVTHIGGLGNIIIDGFNGYISNLSVESLCETIERALYYPISLDGPMYALSKHRWESEISKLLRIHIGIEL